MMPFLTEELNEKSPAALRMPHPDDESLNVSLYMQDFMLKRNLLYLVTE
jgi:hypothetical protein